MIDSSIIQKATEALLAVVPAGSSVILFGSHATGRADVFSDMDFLVVEPEVDDRIKEMLRLTEALRPTKIPVDVLVLSRNAFERWKNTPNSIAYRVAREGKVYGHAT